MQPVAAATSGGFRQAHASRVGSVRLSHPKAATVAVRAMVLAIRVQPGAGGVHHRRTYRRWLFRRSRPVDGKGVDIQQTDKSRVNQFTPTTTTDPPEGDGGRQPDVVVPTELRYPECLGGERLAAARAIIETCPAEQRQPVLEELDAMQAARRARRPLGPLHRLVERANRGEFFPNLPNLSARVSRPRPPINAKRGTPETRGNAPAGGAVPASDIAQETLVRIREMLKQT
jgi:hypothetical protein